MRQVSLLLKDQCQIVSHPGLSIILFFTDLLDTKQANSKYYNPATFDPASADYQDDVRLAVRDELPDELDSSDIAESFYSHLFSTELTWPPMFFGIWAAGEPDVSFICFIHCLFLVAHCSLSMGKGSSESNVPWRARPKTLPNW